MDYNSKKMKRGRLYAIIEADLEYLIAILVSGSFLATLTKHLGFSDSLTGILASMISLGCLFELITMFIRKSKIKRFVIFMSIANQLLFLFLYVTPVVPFSQSLKTAVFVISIISAYLIYYIAYPSKISWLMSIVDDSHRGRFTANKEIISLISGMVFSYSMGAFIDYFKAKNNIRTAFIISAVVIFVLMILHTLTMVLTIEPDKEEKEKTSLIESVKKLAKNKNIVKVAAIFIIYYAANYAARPFYGTYQINELGFSLKFISFLSISESIVRIFVSKFWGSYADKNSFALMIEKCMIFFCIGMLAAIFAVPSNAKILLMVYYICHGIALGGLNSALINLVFDYSDKESRADSLAICQSVAGLSGFICTLVMSVILAAIQKNGNSILGIQIYAQQFLSLIAFIIGILAILFVRFVVIGKRKI